MPRKGMGQKVQTATGQQYGQAKAQEEAQAEIPLPSIQDVLPAMRPGEKPVKRPSERPNEPVTAAPGQLNVPTPEDTEFRRKRSLSLLPVLEQMASEPFASPQLRNLVREMKMFVGPLEEL